MAAQLGRALQIDVALIAGRYGEYKVLVDDDVVLDVGILSALGILPSSRKVIELVRRRLRAIEMKNAGDA